MKCFEIFTIWLLELIFVVSDRPKYRDDYRYEKAFNAFYKIHLTAVKWSEARLRCEAEGAELMAPESLDEADAMPLIIAPVLNGYDGVFIGVHDLYSEGSYVTIKGSDMHNTILGLLWDSKQPAYGDGRCVAMRRTGRLFVHPCTVKLPFICKTRAVDIYYNPDCDTYDRRWQKGHSGDCYILHTDPLTWHQAYATCLSAGGHLMVLNSRAEARHVRELFKHVPERRIPDNFFAFLGYSDLFQRHHYRTIFGQHLDETGYKDWDFKCLQNTDDDKPLRCGGIRRSGLLKAGDCDTPAVFFCEKSLNNTKSKDNLRINTIHRFHNFEQSNTLSTTTDVIYFQPFP